MSWRTRSRANPVCVKWVFSGASMDPSGGILWDAQGTVNLERRKSHGDHQEERRWIDRGRRANVRLTSSALRERQWLRFGPATDCPDDVCGVFLVDP